MAQQDVSKIKRTSCPHTVFSVANQPREPLVFFLLNNLKKMNLESPYPSAFEGVICNSANTKRWRSQSTSLWSFLTPHAQLPLPTSTLHWCAGMGPVMPKYAPRSCASARPPAHVSQPAAVRDFFLNIVFIFKQLLAVGVGQFPPLLPKG